MPKVSSPAGQFANTLRNFKFIGLCGGLTVGLLITAKHSLSYALSDNKNRGFGFVEFAEEVDAAEAVANMDGSELYGRTLRVTVARPMQKKSQAVWQDAETWWRSLQEEEGAEEAVAGAGESVQSAK